MRQPRNDATARWAAARGPGSLSRPRRASMRPTEERGMAGDSSPKAALQGLARESLRQLRRGMAGMLALPASAAIGFGAMLMAASLLVEGPSKRPRVLTTPPPRPNVNPGHVAVNG